MPSIRHIIIAAAILLASLANIAHAQESIPTRVLIRATDGGQEVAQATLAESGYPVTFVHEYPVFTIRLYSFDNPLTGSDLPIIRTLLEQLIAKKIIVTGDFDVPVAIETGSGQTGSLWVTGMNVGDFQSQYGRLMIGSYFAAERATGLGVKIAIIDSGMTFGAPIASEFTLQVGYTVMGGIAQQGGVPVDQGDGNGPDYGVGHGTFVAGLISCVAPAARHLHIKVLDDEGACDLADVVSALEVSINENVHVANMSLIPSQPTATLASVITDARNHGIIVVASAGNTNPTVNPYVGSESSLIQVGSSTHLDEARTLAQPWIDLYAPGVSNVPVGQLPPAAEAVVGPLWLDENGLPVFAASSGTSFAAAFVSGAAAAFRSANPDWPNAEVPADEITQRFFDASLATGQTIQPEGQGGEDNSTSGGVKRLDAAELVRELPRVPRCRLDIVAAELNGSYQFIIDSADLSALLSSWNPLGSDPRRIERANITFDPLNKVDSEDLSRLLNLWGSSPPPRCN
jgi:hypothetical protein